MSLTSYRAAPPRDRVWGIYPRWRHYADLAHSDDIGYFDKSYAYGPDTSDTRLRIYSGLLGDYAGT